MSEAGIPVAVLALTAEGRARLTGLVEAAGHHAAEGDAGVLLADADAAPARTRLPMVILGETEAHGVSVLPADAGADWVDAAIRAAAVGLTVRVPEPGGFGPAREGSPLTPRETEILGLLTEGASNKAIARDLGISAHTVKFHLETIFRKLGVTSRAEAVGIGLRQGLLEL